MPLDVTAKSLLLSDKDLASWHRAIAHDDRFARVLMHIDAMLVQSGDWNPDRLSGARYYKELLLTIADDEPEVETSYPDPELKHDLEPKLRTQNEQVKNPISP